MPVHLRFIDTDDESSVGKKRKGLSESETFS